MTIPSKSWNQFVQDMVALWGAQLGIVPVLDQGDFLLALFEAVAGQLDFVQAQVFMVLALTRAATSSGSDLDSWMADFNFFRLASTYATGSVTLGKLQAASSPIFVPAATLTGGVYTGGVLVQTVGGGVVYTVIPDTTQSAYVAQSNSYVIPAGTLSISATVQALVGGASGNVAAGTIVQLGSQSSVDTVTNPLPITNGFSAESDQAFRARFILYLSTLAKATGAAITAAIQSVQQGVQVSLAENQNPAGVVQLGTFTAFISNNSLAPSSSLLASAFAAADATRAFCVQPYVAAVSNQVVTITMTVRLAAGSTLSALQLPIAQAVVAVADSLTANQTLYVSAVEQAAMSVGGVVAVRPGTTINGQTLDLTPAVNTQVEVTIGGVMVSQY